jgi:hypothetical protein
MSNTGPGRTAARMVKTKFMEKMAQKKKMKKA